MTSRSFVLNTGAKIPAIGLGTYLSEPNQVGNAVKAALDVGYRHLDLAAVYNNEQEIGVALKEWFAAHPQVKRSDVFITSKLWNTFHRPELVPKTFDKTLKDLQLDYLDLYLMHWPVAFVPRDVNDLSCSIGLDGKNVVETDKVKLIDTWRAMEKLVATGKVKAIGVSNFNAPTLEHLAKNASIVPAVNQCEFHPYLPQDDLLAVAAKLKVHLTAYSPLGSGNSKLLVREDPVAVAISKKHNVSPAQVLIAWGVQRGTSVIPKSISADRIRANFTDVVLDADDLKQLSTLSKVNLRVVNPKSFFNIDIFQNQLIE